MDNRGGHAKRSATLLKKRRLSVITTTIKDADRESVWSFRVAGLESPSTAGSVEPQA